MTYKPFKMRGSPFKRNFGVGDSEALDTTSPLNASPTKGLLGKALSAGMATLPGGYDKNKQREDAAAEASKDYERGEDGELILDDEGKPIEKENEAEVKEEGPSIVENIVKNLFFKKNKEKEETTEEDAV